MNYNTQRGNMPMPEYGRSVQEMVDHALTIEDRAERQRCAETIISIMAGMFPQQREVDDYQNKLWDHLAYMSGYQLDVDYPCEITRLGGERIRPDRISYPKGGIRFRHYGRTVPELIGKAADMQEGPERDQLIRLAAVQMKKDLMLWNKEMVDDARIAEDIRQFSDGRIVIDGELLRSSFPQQGQQQNQQAQGQQRQGQRQRRNRKRY